MSLGAATVKKCFLELGGKSPNIVLEDADFARGIGMSTFMVCLHGGQGCATLSRLLLPASRFEEGVELAAQQLSSMKYGDPTVTGNIMGPLNSARQSARLKKAEMPAESSIGTIGTPYGAFLAYRRDHPADDFLSTLIEARFTDVFTGEECGLTYQEILNYVGMLYAAGNETTARLIGWMGKILAEHPDQRAAVVADPSLVPASGGGDTPIRGAVADPDPRAGQARRAVRADRPRGRHDGAAYRVGQPGRARLRLSRHV